MSHISKKTMRRLVVMYLVGKFTKGVYSSFRFQKVLYCALKSAELRPFPYRHTEFGQYSNEAEAVLRELISIRYIEASELSQSKFSGTGFRVNDKDDFNYYVEMIGKIAGELQKQIDASVKLYGYMSQDDLDHQAHSEPELKSTPLYGMLFDDNLDDEMAVNLSDEECEDLELALNPRFIAAMEHIVDALDDLDFDTEKVKSGDFDL